MITITSNTNTVKIDIPEALLHLDEITHKVVYILRDKACFVGLDSKDRWVTIRLVDGSEYRLDLTGEHGLPISSVNGKNIATIEELCTEMAKLKTL